MRIRGRGAVGARQLGAAVPAPAHEASLVLRRGPGRTRMRGSFSCGSRSQARAEVEARLEIWRIGVIQDIGCNLPYRLSVRDYSPWSVLGPVVSSGPLANGGLLAALGRQAARRYW